MNKPFKLQRGDKVAIVSLSSGILGEEYCRHQLDLGIKRLLDFGLTPVMMKHTLSGVELLNRQPNLRAQDLKDAFFDDSIKGIVCAIGGDDTFRLTPYLLEDEAFIQKVKSCPKLFSGFSDSTNNHLLFYKLGMISFYGPNFLSDLAELEEQMLPYTKEAFLTFFENAPTRLITTSPIWYESRLDFSTAALFTPRIAHVENRGYEVLFGSGIVEGVLLGGCLESLYDGYTGSRYPEQKELYVHYQMMPSIQDWKGKVLFIETSEECPSPELFFQYLTTLQNLGILSVISAMLIGKPQNEVYYEEYKQILTKIVVDLGLPAMYNIPFGHSFPRTVIPIGVTCLIDFNQRLIQINECVFRD
ncbi:MAG: S66 peptidase family protein [Candidatus Izemoplasmatales bacterium]|nr:S66 peptidase family protein [Candidatus Izemoplasmatales bacterium]